MYLNANKKIDRPAQFNIANAGCMGTTQKMELSRDYPIEELRIRVDFHISADLTLALKTAVTPAQLDSILGIAAKINLTITDPILGLRSVVDCSGRGLIEANLKNGVGIDFGTQVLAAIGQVQNVAGTLTNPILKAGWYSVTYRIPFAFPAVGEPLRSFCLLPVHLHKQNPVLTITYAQPTDFSAGTAMTVGAAQVFDDLKTTVTYLRRVPNAASEAAIAAKGGYLSYDYIETNLSIPVNTTSEQKLQLPLPGQYDSLVIRQYLGGAYVTRNTVELAGVGDTLANGAGVETRWRLESALNVIQEWFMRDMQVLNDESAPITFIAAAAGTIVPAQFACPNFEGAIMPSTNKRPAALVKLDFLGDGLTGDTGNELGSLLDCDTPNATGRKMEIIFQPASVATNASQVFVIGHRFLDPTGKQLAIWQQFFK